ncbi:MAG: hypothetical protein AB1716_18680 [Planctomycetota bacterium]
MDHSAVLYNWLAGDVSAEANAILGAALAHAEPAYAERIAAILLQRRHESAWAGLVAGFHRLSAASQAHVRGRANLLWAGIADAVKLSDPQARLNALQLLAERPCPQLLYLAAESLRSTSPALSETAARTLRAAAEQLLQHDPLPAPDKAAPASGPPTNAAADRAALVAALAEALRTYDVHRRADVLEACLWYAPELGDVLWDALGPAQSSAARTVETQLAGWDHPRLAPFLLTALGRPAWHQRALQILGGWSTRDQLVALLECSRLLALPGVRDNLHFLRRPAILAAAGPALSNLPSHLRGRLPHWILYLGFTDAERLRVLRAWLAMRAAPVRSGAAYALAALGTPEARAALAEIAAEPTAAGRFARWYIAGRAPAGARQSQAPAGSSLAAATSAFQPGPE